MPDEQTYVGTLVTFEEALRRLASMEAHIVNVAYVLWRRTVEKQAQQAVLRKPEEGSPTKHQDRANDLEQTNSMGWSPQVVSGRSKRWSRFW